MATQLTCDGKYQRYYETKSVFTYPPYAPKVKLLFREKDMSFLFSLSMALVLLWMFVHASLLPSQSGLAKVELIHPIILSLLLLSAPYLSLI